MKTDTSPAEQDVLAQAERYLNGIDTLQARFLQLSSTGNSVEGDVFMDRPGRMRLEYEGMPILMVANGRHLIYVDEELDQVSYLGLDQTPVGVLLRPNVSFQDEDITVTDVRRGANVAEIDVVQTKDPGAGQLTLVFTEKPFELRQWRVRDAQNVETAVSLFNTRTGMDLPGSLFDYSEKIDPLNPMGRK
ncbi:MAG: outer membrane lipoprotein carrier protein LolA [Caenispirillum bisanense]|nr:outer membrane lipoprotein carrier protein LolA [Caenispirillum bisanense]